MLLKVQVEPLTEIPFQVDACLRALPDVHFGTGLFGPLIARRTPEIVASDNKDFYIIINMEGPFRIRLPRIEFILDEGDACFLSCAEEANFIRPLPGRLICARVNGTRLKSQLPDAMDFSGRAVRRGNEPLRLLATYLRDMDDHQGLTGAELRTLVTAHIFNLLALTLNSTRDAARTTSPVAAKLDAIKRFVADNLSDASDPASVRVRADHILGIPAAPAPERRARGADGFAPGATQHQRDRAGLGFRRRVLFQSRIPQPLRRVADRDPPRRAHVCTGRLETQHSLGDDVAPDVVRAAMDRSLAYASRGAEP
jgi:hypothetical protein